MICIFTVREYCEDHLNRWRQETDNISLDGELTILATSATFLLLTGPNSRDLGQAVDRGMV